MSSKIGTEKAIADIETTWLRVAMTIIMVVIMFVPLLIYSVLSSVFHVVDDSITAIIESFYESKD